MAKLVTFKPAHHVLTVGGRTITSADLTPELYDELIKISPNFAELFDVIEETKEAKVGKKGDPA
jgi:molybdopterin biosynthesis enzyme MoaB